MGQSILTFAGGMLTLVLVFAGIAIWLENRRASRRRELEHVERMKAIESEYPLPDEDSSRHKILGGIGIVVPVGSLAVAAWSTQLILDKEELLAPRWLLTVIWGVAGLVALVVGVVAAAALRPRKVNWPSKPLPHHGGEAAVKSACETA